MKKIVILLEEKIQDYAAGVFIKDNIIEVLEDTVSIDVLFLSDMKVRWLKSMRYLQESVY